MPAFDEEPRPKPAAHVVGEDLARLSEEDLKARIDILRAEVERIESALASKQASRKAASSFFKS